MSNGGIGPEAAPKLPNETKAQAFRLVLNIWDVAALFLVTFGGRRVRIGAAYEAVSAGFEYCGVIEFADLDGLAAYLKHQAHDELGRLFYETSAEAFAGDFDAVASAPAAALAAWRTQE